MQKIIILLIAVFITLVLKSQEDSLFNYNYPLEWPYDCNSMLIHDSSYFIAGDVGRVIEGCGSVVYGYHVSKINSSGIKDTTVIYDKCEQTSYIGWKGAMQSKDDNVFIMGHVFNYPNYNRLFLLKLDFNLDTVSNTYFMDDTITKRAFSFVFDDNDNVVFCGGGDSTYNEMLGTPETTYSKSYLGKVSQSGEMIWQRSYSFGDITDGCWSTFHRVINTYDKGYITIGRSSDFGNSKNLILKTDSLGNQQWVKFFGSSSYSNPTFTDIIETQDSCYIVCGAYTYGETFGGLYPYDGWLLKLDINGNLKWDKKYRDYVAENTDWRDTIYNIFNGIAELHDGKIALVATSKNGTTYGRKPKLYLLSAEGDTIFTKLFEKPNYWYNSKAILATNDGGYAIAGEGEFYDWNESTESWEESQRIFLIKTDSLGNDTLINSIVPYNPKPITNFVLNCYPNPARFEAFVEMPQKIKDDILIIYSTSGQVVHEQAVVSGENRIDLCGLKSGMYLLSLQGSGLFGKLVVE